MAKRGIKSGKCGDSNRVRHSTIEKRIGRKTPNDLELFGVFLCRLCSLENVCRDIIRGEMGMIWGDLRVLRRLVVISRLLGGLWGYRRQRDNGQNEGHGDFL